MQIAKLTMTNYNGQIHLTQHLSERNDRARALKTRQEIMRHSPTAANLRKDICPGRLLMNPIQGLLEIP